MTATEKQNPVPHVFDNEKDRIAVADMEKQKRQLLVSYENLDSSEEQAFAEIGILADLAEWPEY